MLKYQTPFVKQTLGGGGPVLGEGIFFLHPIIILLFNMHILQSSTIVYSFHPISIHFIYLIF